MNIIGEFKCPQCGKVHAGISAADATAAVEGFNTFYATLDTDERRKLFGNKEASLAEYQRCTRCGSPSADFVPVRENELRPEATQPAVIAPSIS